MTHPDTLTAISHFDHVHFSHDTVDQKLLVSPKPTVFS